MNEIIVDSFAGGGGASTGILLALGRSPDIAINHDYEAIAMHAVNHPETTHYCEDVWHVDPVTACAGRPVQLMWLSPDCKHFSKAKGGKPVEKKIRGLAWIAVKWAKAVRPRIIILENVEEFQDWGPVLDDGQPCPIRRGLTFRRFVRQLENTGYKVDFRELRACDYGAPTTRKRLFLVARCDGQPIVWPQPTHGPGRQPYRTAASCIDWTIPVPSIFDRDRPLAENTLRRIALGVKKFVLDAENPYVVPTTRGLAGATLVQTGYGERPGQAPRVPGLHKPLGTAVDGQKHALVTAFLAKQNGVGEKMVLGQPLGEPAHTITATDQKAIVATRLARARKNDRQLDLFATPPDNREKVRAFLIKFYSEGGQWNSLADPMPTIPTKDRMGLVTVKGEDYIITDIGLRMLQPRELFRAQGFPESYIIDFALDGKPLSKSAQVRMCGNSVCPPIAEALVRAQFAEQAARRAA